MIKLLKDFTEVILTLLYPASCPVCGKTVNSSDGWCADCLPEALFAKIDIKKHKLFFLSECIALYKYEGCISHMIKDIKFRDKKIYAGKLRRLLQDYWIKNIITDFDIVVPVPISAKRIQKRGYNQTTLIFQQWAVVNKLIWQDVLLRTRDTKPQWSLSRTERKANVNNAFRVKKECMDELRNKKVLVVDDVFTTGFTLEECAKTLKYSGVRSVKGLVLASGSVI